MGSFPDCRERFDPAPGRTGALYSLRKLERAGVARVSRLPLSIRIVLESLLRNLDGKRVREADVLSLARWEPSGRRTDEVPFVVARVLLQDFTGVPLLVDLAAMRSAVARLDRPPTLIQPLVPVDLVVDHSVQVDYYGRPDALDLNLGIELRRNRPRYEFLKWGSAAFDGVRIVPPGVGICHQVNIEHLAKGVVESRGVFHPDTLVGTDSHTTMVNGIGVVGWGVGGIEAEAAMLGQPVSFLQPDVVGVHLSGALGPGVTATDLVLAVTERLRKTDVVGKFVEFHGEGVSSLTAAERATIANMAPEYGATLALFPTDAETLRYFRATGRPEEHVAMMRRYLEEQDLFGVPASGACDYTEVVEIDCARVVSSVAGPKRPQDRIDLDRLSARWKEILAAPPPAGYGIGRDGAGLRVAAKVGVIARPARGEGVTVTGGGEQQGLPVPRDPSPRNEIEMMNNRPTPNPVQTAHGSHVPVEIGHGSVVIAAITSCTNTSNPDVMLAAGLLAKHAVMRGLRPPPHVKTSLAPGSRAVTEYLARTGLLSYLGELGFDVVGYGCTTCIGNSGPLDPHLEEAIVRNGVVAASVLSGNRNFEARIHQNVKANFLASPPLVVAFALAGRVDVDLTREPIGKDGAGRDVFLREIWPNEPEIAALMDAASDPAMYGRLYADARAGTPLWQEIQSPGGVAYAWDPASTYIREPPFFESFARTAAPSGDVLGARALAIFGDSVTTDHVSPAGAIDPGSPAARYLEALGVDRADFNSYGARRGNHEVMVRGTFGNVRIKNLMVRGTEGGMTAHQPDGERMTIFDAAQRYAREGVPLVVLAGREYGTGSSRDWAAKGPRLLGVRAIVARSFERIHRSNLVGMGVLPCQFAEGAGAETWGLDGTERYDLRGVAGLARPLQAAKLIATRRDGVTVEIPVTVRIDTPIEVEYWRHGGILPYTLRHLLGES